MPEATHIAQGRNGQWYAYHGKPIMRSDFGAFINANPNIQRPIEFSDYDWETSLQELPKESKKRKLYLWTIQLSSGTISDTVQYYANEEELLNKLPHVKILRRRDETALDDPAPPTLKRYSVCVPENHCFAVFEKVFDAVSETHAKLKMKEYLIKVSGNDADINIMIADEL